MERFETMLYASENAILKTKWTCILNTVSSFPLCSSTPRSRWENICAFFFGLSNSISFLQVKFHRLPGDVLWACQPLWRAGPSFRGAKWMGKGSIFCNPFGFKHHPLEGASKWTCIACSSAWPLGSLPVGPIWRLDWKPVGCFYRFVSTLWLMKFWKIAAVIF